MIYIRRNTVLKTLLSLIVVLVVVKIQPSTFFTTLDFLPSPSNFYPHPRLFTLTLDFLPSPSTLDPRHSTLDKNLNSNKACTILIHKKGETANSANFRPITLESVPIKVLTSCLRNRTFQFLAENNYIEQNIQKGFTPINQIHSISPKTIYK